jgi:hypothetical protein
VLPRAASRDPWGLSSHPVLATVLVSQHRIMQHLSTAIFTAGSVLPRRKGGPRCEPGAHLHPLAFSAAQSRLQLSAPDGVMRNPPFRAKGVFSVFNVKFAITAHAGVQHGKAAELSTACAARGRGAPRGGMAGRACSNWRETGTKRRSVDALRQLTRVCCVPIHHRTPTAVSIASSASIYGHSVVHTAFPGTSRSPLSPY